MGTLRVRNGVVMQALQFVDGDKSAIHIYQVPRTTDFHDAASNCRGSHVLKGSLVPKETRNERSRAKRRIGNASEVDPFSADSPACRDALSLSDPVRQGVDRRVKQRDGKASVSEQGVCAVDRPSNGF